MVSTTATELFHYSVWGPAPGSVCIWHYHTSLHIEHLQKIKESITCKMWDMVMWIHECLVRLSWFVSFSLRQKMSVFCEPCDWPETPGCGRAHGQGSAGHVEVAGALRSSEEWPDLCWGWLSGRYAGWLAVNIFLPSYLKYRQMRAWTGNELA